MMAYMRFKSKKDCSRGVLSLASNKKIYTRNGEGGREASRASLFYWSTKRTQWRNKDPLFIIATNVETNTIYTGLSSQHPGLFRKGLFIENQKYIGFGMI
jgi:tRNA-specific 2-thiouridylase